MSLLTAKHPGVVIRGIYRGHIKPYVRSTQKTHWRPEVKAYHASRDRLRLHFDRVFQDHGWQRIGCPFRVGLAIVAEPTLAGNLPGNKGDWDNYYKALVDALAWKGTSKRRETPFVPGDDLRWLQGACDVGGLDPIVYLGTRRTGWQFRWQIETVGARLWIEEAEATANV